MKVERFLELCPSDFFAGVPDSQLKALCDELMEKYGTGRQHHIVANEGNAVALAAGYHLASGKVPMVYLQNSGEGNAMNPLVSLASERVYGIPLLLVIGYRGEPGVKDEPQHLFQGEITLDFLKLLQIPYFVLEKESKEEELKNALEGFAKEFQKGRQAAIVVKKGALEKEHGYHYSNAYNFSREDAIRCIVDYTGDSPIVSTTGKASRELYEIREERLSYRRFHGTCQFHSFRNCFGKGERKDCLSGRRRRSFDAYGGYGSSWIIGAKKYFTYPFK